MRNLLLIAAVGTLGLCGGVAYAANPNVPGYSPYALMDVPSTGAPMVSPAPVLSESRAAFVEGATAGPNTNVPSYSPYAIMPQAR